MVNIIWSYCLQCQLGKDGQNSQYDKQDQHFQHGPHCQHDQHVLNDLYVKWVNQMSWTNFDVHEIKLYM